jgi:hypothetical protein
MARDNKPTSNTISLSDLLLSQKQAGTMATIETVESDDTAIKITPWIPNVGCHCNSALTVKKVSIKELKLTGESHVCCGKRLKVVEVSFKSDAVIPIEELFAQKTKEAISAAAQNSSHVSPASQYASHIRSAIPDTQGVALPQCMPKQHPCYDPESGYKWCCPDGWFCGRVPNTCSH